MVRRLGGELLINPGEKSGTFQIYFDSVTPEQVNALLFSFDPDTMVAPLISERNGYLEEILNTIKEFMYALSRGDLDRSEEILFLLAEHRHQAGIYDEIGAIARELHNSLKHFMSTIDSALREMVEDRIPDSGNRLEHILELTEKAATTTLNHVEAMQNRNKEEHEKLLKLEELLGKLNAIGEKSQGCLEESHAFLENLIALTKQNHDDLITVLTAQDYQDLTGQIILKIIKILKDLEYKLVNLIRTFGVKYDKRKQPPSKDEREELYGPAYEDKEGALQSQDDVDNLLAEFGF
jgi:chemotaxis protein CheZ